MDVSLLEIWLALVSVQELAVYYSGAQAGESFWADWWSYDGISGPSYWGLLNSDWELCNRGRYQSPIDIHPKTLVFDPLLSNIRIGSHKVVATVVNTGHDVSFRFNLGVHSFLMGGPLAYKYRIYQIKIHFGGKDTQGSEHSIVGKTFPVEFQVLGYNDDLYQNATEASRSPHGLVGLAVFAQIENSSTADLQEMFDTIQLVPYKGNTTTIFLDISALLPETQFYMTYDGSLSFPPCQEVVTWLVMNRPITITRSQIEILRQLYGSDESSPAVPMENNFRETVSLGTRTVRTNIRPAVKQEKVCNRGVKTNYKINSRFRH